MTTDEVIKTKVGVLDWPAAAECLEGLPADGL